MRLLGPADDSTIVRVTPGEPITLELPENPGTGFRWHILGIPSCLTVDADDFIAPGATPPGGGGLRRWAFRADRAGSGTLRIQLQAPSRRSEPAPPFTLMLDVAGDLPV